MKPSTSRKDETPAGSKRASAETRDQTEVDPIGTLSILAGICGIAVFWLPWLNLLFPLISITLGAVSLRGAGKDAVGNLSAVGGVVLGSVLLLLGLFVIDVAGSLSEVLR
ncbi:hypothetical protein [Arthrobacter rhizosphaerae]|uniref:hypothetical protein n=1 Tax=Arthrobacter rhizosphaerae TaxID=2855490 RepID=UPI001FF0E94B|nr:hypothetical protein [Arthrobacter rhizosphaerae]